MGVNLAVKVRCGPGSGIQVGSTGLMAMGVPREVESEGSRRQNPGPMDKNRLANRQVPKGLFGSVGRQASYWLPHTDRIGSKKSRRLDIYRNICYFQTGILTT